MSTKNEITRYLEEEMKDAYLDYSMSVIVSRALPDARDGLKPIHRRILFGAEQTGNTHDKPYKKSAKLVGHVLGTVHPHGDSSVYSAAVRMAQNFSLRYPMIDGHGNFGSIDGDAAASMRYTELRMTKLAEEMLQDLDKETVAWKDNYDSTIKEPVVLPSKLPNLLLNGSEGIAVGMATKIPPHNLTELCNGLLHLLEEPEAEVEALLTHIKGPDFPTAGVIYGTKGIEDAYKTGRGRIRIGSKTHFEEVTSQKQAIIVTEIPYQVNKARLIEKIADLVKEKKVSGISDLRDESDRKGIRIVIELKKHEDPEIILNQLLKFTDLQITFGVIMLALVDNVPKVLNLKEVLEIHLAHRKDVITKRTGFELKKALEKEHLLEGYVKALADVDKIIEVIKKAKNPQVAKETLQTNFSFSETQAKAVLELKLQKLTSLENDKINEDLTSITLEIKKLKAILNSEELKKDLIATELKDLITKYGDERRTKLEVDYNEINIEDLIKPEEVIVTLTNKGYLKRSLLETYKAQRRGGKGTSAQVTVEEDFVESMYTASTLDTLMIFTDKGKAYSMKVYDLPESSKQARGKLVENLIQLDPDEKVRRILKVKDFETEELFFLTKNGKCKKTSLELFKNLNKSGIIATKLDASDDLIYVGLINSPTQEILVATKKGKAIRFDQSELRSIGRNTEGVRAIKLKDNDAVVAGVVISPTDQQVLTITENGFGKRTLLTEYTTQARAGQGVLNFKLTEKTGDVTNMKLVTEEEELIVITTAAVTLRTSVKNTPLNSRNTQGVKVIKTKAKIASLVVVKPESKIEEVLEE